MPSHYERAAYRLRHSLLRRAAGEHCVDAERLIAAFATEWNLTTYEIAQLRRLADVTIAELRERAEQ